MKSPTYKRTHPEGELGDVLHRFRGYITHYVREEQVSRKSNFREDETLSGTVTKVIYCSNLRPVIGAVFNSKMEPVIWWYITKANARRTCADR